LACGSDASITHCSPARPSLRVVSPWPAGSPTVSIRPCHASKKTWRHCANASPPHYSASSRRQALRKQRRSVCACHQKTHSLRKVSFQRNPTGGRAAASLTFPGLQIGSGDTIILIAGMNAEHLVPCRKKSVNANGVEMPAPAFAKICFRTL